MPVVGGRRWALSVHLARHVDGMILRHKDATRPLPEESSRSPGLRHAGPAPGRQTAPPFDALAVVWHPSGQASGMTPAPHNLHDGSEILSSWELARPARTGVHGCDHQAASAERRFRDVHEVLDPRIKEDPRPAVVMGSDQDRPAWRFLLVVPTLRRIGVRWGVNRCRRSVVRRASRVWSDLM